MINSLPMVKPRLLYISYTPPIPTWGGAMAFYRHFIERKDFEIKVITSSSELLAEPLSYQPLRFGLSPLSQRIFRTRLLPWVYGLHSLISWGRVPAAVWQAAYAFKPDVIFTIAGSWDYSALIAERVARRLPVARGMSARRVVTAAHVAACQALAQVDPLRALA